MTAVVDEKALIFVPPGREYQKEQFFDPSVSTLGVAPETKKAKPAPLRRSREEEATTTTTPSPRKASLGLR